MRITRTLSKWPVQVAKATAGVKAAKVVKVAQDAQAAMAALVTKPADGDGKAETGFPTFSLPELSTRQKNRLLKIILQILEIQYQISSGGNNNILHHTLEQKHRHVKMLHYPKGDRIDFSTGAQYFYHCHREDLNSMEHGHFHVFLRYKNIPEHISPFLPPDEKNTSPMTHLTAISMNRYGQPIRLFTVNRWVSSDVWYQAAHAETFIKQFKMTLKDNAHWTLLDKWVENMLKLFAPQIIWLHHARDYKMSAHCSDIYEDKSLEELSSVSIDLNQQIEWVMQS